MAAGSQLLQVGAREDCPRPGHSSHQHESASLAELATGLGRWPGQIGRRGWVLWVTRPAGRCRGADGKRDGTSRKLLRTKRGAASGLERVPTALETAEQCFHRALDVGATPGRSLSWELRAAMSLASVSGADSQRASQGGRKSLLAPVYHRFQPRGFGSSDLCRPPKSSFLPSVSVEAMREFPPFPARHRQPMPSGVAGIGRGRGSAFSWPPKAF